MCVRLNLQVPVAVSIHSISFAGHGHLMWFVLCLYSKYLCWHRQRWHNLYVKRTWGIFQKRQDVFRAPLGAPPLDPRMLLESPRVALEPRESPPDDRVRIESWSVTVETDHDSFLMKFQNIRHHSSESKMVKTNFVTCWLVTQIKCFLGCWHGSLPKSYQSRSYYTRRPSSSVRGCKFRHVWDPGLLKSTDLTARFKMSFGGSHAQYTTFILLNEL